MQVNPRLPGYRMWGHFRLQPISFAVSWHALAPPYRLGDRKECQSRPPLCALRDELGRPSPQFGGRILRIPAT
jgi:hypothetical protein